MVIEAVFERGVFRPREQVSLPEGQVVEVHVPGGDEAAETARALDDLMALAGLVHGDDASAASEERVSAALADEYASTCEG